MSKTPRTDEQELAYVAEDGSTYVHTTFARKLEREIAELLKDAQRLDWLLDENSCNHIERGRYNRFGNWLGKKFHNRSDIDKEMEEL